MTLGTSPSCYKPKHFRHLTSSGWKGPKYQPYFPRQNFSSLFISFTLILCAEKGNISNNLLLSQGNFLEISRVNVVYLMCLKTRVTIYNSIIYRITQQGVFWIFFSADVKQAKGTFAQTGLFFRRSWGPPEMFSADSSEDLMRTWALLKHQAAEWRLSALEKNILPHLIMKNKHRTRGYQLVPSPVLSRSSVKSALGNVPLPWAVY